MDADRFDSLSKSLAARTTRRATVSFAAIGGLLGGFGLAPEVRAAQQGTCTLALSAGVRVGPGLNQPLTAGANQPGTLTGNVIFSLSASGGIQNGTFQLPNGASVPVVGQATGNSLQLRIALGQDQTVVAVGVGERDVIACRGAFDGLISGPNVGDIGDWHATASGELRAGGQAAGAGQASGGNQGGNQGATGNQGGRAGRNKPRGQNQGGGQGGATNPPPPATTPPPTSPPPTSPSPTGGSPTTCPQGQTFCDLEEGYCADLMTNALNCGACGNICVTPNTQCQNGVCVAPSTDTGTQCTAGMSRCGETCVDLANDDDNCGSCGTVCGQVEGRPGVFNFCENGQCVPPQCEPGFTDCSGLCDDLMTSPLNCGACGTACETGLTCVAGECTSPGGGGCLAGSGLTFCNGQCVDLTSDNLNCGECGVACVEGTVCEASTCVTAGGGGCIDGLTLCNGQCVDVTSDVFNCGACGATCGEEEMCQGSACVPAGGGGCVGGLALCNGACVDVLTDPANCGNCGIACGADTACLGGTCVSTAPLEPEPVGCDAGLTDCGGVCVDTASDPSNCGGCGVLCDSGICTGSACQA